MKYFIPEDNEDFCLDCSSPAIQNMVIQTFRRNKIKVFEDTKCYDEEYPILFWDASEKMLSQTPSNDDKEICSLEKFIEKFTNPNTLKLNDSYIAKFTKTCVEVGCQSFSYETIDKLYEMSVKFRKK